MYAVGLVPNIDEDKSVGVPPQHKSRYEKPAAFY